MDPFPMWGTMLSNLLITFSVILICTLRFRSFRFPLTLWDIGIKKERCLSLLFVGLAAGFLAFSLSFLILWGAGAVAIVRIGLANLLTTDMLLWFLLFVSVGFGEEILCRGLVFAAIKKGGGMHNRWLVLGLSSLFFAIIHMGNNGIHPLAFVNLLGAGVLLGALYIGSGSLWLSIGFHITWNFVQGNVYGFYVSGIAIRHAVFELRIVGDKWLTGGMFGPEGGLAVSISLAAGIILVLWGENRWFRSES